jgi:hypothetical protein
MNIMYIQQVAEQRFPERITWTAPPNSGMSVSGQWHPAMRSASVRVARTCFCYKVSVVRQGGESGRGYDGFLSPQEATHYWVLWLYGFLSDRMKS